MQVRTVPELFQRAIHEHGPRTAVRYRREGDWQPITYGQLGRLVEEAALGLIEAGVERGETVAVVARNGPQAAIAEQASLHAGATVLAIDADRGDRLGAVADIDLAAAFLEPAIAETCDEEEAAAATIVELAASPGADQGPAGPDESSRSRSTMAQLHREGQQAARRGRSLEERLQAIGPSDPAHLVPARKGGARVLTHDAVLTQARAMASLVELAASQRCLSLSGPGDPLQRSVGWHACMASGAEAWLAREPSRIVADVLSCRPDLVLASPEAYATLREALEERLQASAPSQRRLFVWARSVGQRVDEARREASGLGAGLQLRRLLADRLVLGKARAALGLEKTRIALAPSGIEPELATWHRSIGVPLTRAYAPIGAGGVVSLQRPGETDTTGLGRPLPGVEVRIAGEDGEGEILVRGPAVGRRLDGENEAGAEGRDGWLRTGQRGRLAGGRLRRVDDAGSA